MDVCVIIPTLSWTSACEQVYQQLDDGDELIAVCDSESDPLSKQDTPSDIKVLVAGEPEGCSGKCNALAEALEQAAREHVVCTDADFQHPEGWLDEVKNSLEENEFVTTMNFFKSRKLTGKILEPGYLMGVFTGTYLGAGAWGGLMAFNKDRAPLDDITDQLRRTLSDDLLIGQFFQDQILNTSNFAVVDTQGGFKDALKTYKRFARSIYLMDPKMFYIPFIGVLTYLLFLVSSPVLGLLLPVLIAGLLYANFGVKRLTFLLAPLSIFLVTILVLWGAHSEKIEWNGRTYRWKDKLEVEVLHAE